MKKFALVALLAAGAVWLWRHDKQVDVADGGGGKLLTGRVWIDHLPRNDHDRVQVLALLKKHPFGQFVGTSQWKGAWEGFRYEPRGEGRLAVTWPDTRSTDQVTYSARRCGERGFDFCLDIKGATRGVQRYFSKEGWDLDEDHGHGAADLGREVSDVLAQLPPPPADEQP